MAEYKPLPGGTFQRPITGDWQTAGASISSQLKRGPQEEASLGDFLLYSVPSTVLGFADTVTQTFGITDDGDVENMAKDFWPGLGKHYNQYRDLYGTLGDIAGMFIPGMVAVKAVRTGGKLFKLTETVAPNLAKTKAFRSIFSSGKSKDQLMQQLYKQDMYLARQGVGNVRDLALDPLRKQIAKQATATKVLDGVKENIAFELGVLSTMNASETLYPEEMSFIDNVVLNGGFVGAFAAFDFMMMKRAISRSAVRMGPVAYKANDFLNRQAGEYLVGSNHINLQEPLSRAFKNDGTGGRDFAATLDALMVNAAERELASIQAINEGHRLSYGTVSPTANIRANVLDGQIKAWQEDLSAQFYNLAADKPLFGITSRHTLTKEQNKALINASKNSAMTFIGAISIQGMETFASWELKQTGALEAFQKKMDATVAAIDALKASGKDPEKLADLRREYHKLVTQFRLIDESTAHVIEPDGTENLLRGRKQMYQDGPRKITHQPATQLEPGTFIVQLEEPIFQTRQQLIAITDDFHLLMPQINKPMLNGVDLSGMMNTEPKGFTRIFKNRRDPRLKTEYYTHLLNDMGYDWHYQRGRGLKAFNRLSPEARKIVQVWTDTPRGSNLRQLAQEEAPVYREIYNNYEEVRARAREIAGSKGYIRLYRGEKIIETQQIKEGTGTPNDITSYTSEPKIAAGFGDYTLVRNIDPEDIIMIIGGLGDEYEFIVKGNTKRLYEGDPMVVSKTSVGPVEKTGLQALRYEDVTAAWAGMQRAVEKFKPDPNNPLKFGLAEPYWRLDALTTLLESPAGPSIWQDLVKPSHWLTPNDVKMESIRKKYEEYVKYREMQRASDRGALTLSDAQKLSLTDVIKILNLPGAHDNQMHPMLEFFEGLMARGLDELPADTTYEVLMKKLQFLGKQSREAGIIPHVPEVPSMGNMLRIPEDARPVLMVKKKVEANVDYSRKALVNQQQQLRLELLHDFVQAGQNGADIVHAVFRSLHKTSAAQAAKEVGDMVEGSQRGRGAVAQQGYDAGDNSTLLAAMMVEQVSDKAARKLIERYFAVGSNDFAKIRGVAHRADLDAVAFFIHSRRHGWDLEAGVVQQALPDGKMAVGFKLSDTAFNKKRWKELFPNAGDLQKGTLMPVVKAGPPTPVLLPELAAKVVGHLTTLGEHVYRNTNQLRKMTNRGLMNKKEHWITPVNLARQNHIYVVNEMGQLTAIAHGPTPAAAQANAAQIIEVGRANGESLTLVSKDQMTKYQAFYDEAFDAELKNYSDPLAQTGKATGKSVSTVVDVGPEVLDDVLNTYQQLFESTIRRSRVLYFEPEVRYARMMTTQNAPSAQRKGQDIWSTYIRSIYGNPSLNAHDLIGRTYFTIETLYDNVLTQLWDAKRGATAGFRGDSEARFKELEEKFGAFNPFKSATDYAENTFKVKLPPSMKGNMSKLQNITTTLSLRLFDVGHALLNMTSLAVTLPAVIRATKKPADMTEKEWRAVNGAWGTPIEGSEFTMFKPTRAIVSGIHFMFSAEGRKVWQDAQMAGYFDQSVSEAVKTMMAPHAGYAENLANKAVDVMSFLSDKSEELSRAIAYMMGYNIFQKGLRIQDPKNLQIAAHDFANKVIGNYSANNKPRMFQGAVGMPLGLFTTFMWNYYQRIFSYIENGQVAALATQFAMQSSIFGAQTIPGFTQFNEFFASNYDGSVNPVDGIRNRLGEAGADLFLYGALSNLPKIFGAEDGLALFSRGDVSVTRIPGLWNIENTPSYQAVLKTGQMISESVKAIARNGFSTQQQMEIIAQYSVSRSLKNMAEVFGTGYSLDAMGQVINDDVSTGMALAGNLLGLDTLKEAKNKEVAWRIRSGDLARRERLNTLRKDVRTLIRAGNLNADSMTAVLQRYMAAGGNPEGFAEYLVEQTIAAKTDRNARKLMELMNSSNPQIEDVNRLISSFSLYDNDPDLNE
jgi:hypothetical protein